MLTRLLFESPVWIITLLLIAAIIAGWMYFQYRRRGALLTVLILSALAVTLAIVAAVVETDREQIQSSWQRLEMAMDEQSAAAAMEEVSAEFRAGGLTRVELQRLAEQAVTRLNNAQINFYLFSVREIDEMSATTTVWAHYVPARGGVSAGQQGFQSQWRITYRKDDDNRWRISGAQSIQPPNLNLAWALRQ